MPNTTLIAVTLDYPLLLRGGVGVIVESLLKNLSPQYDVILVSPDESKELHDHPCWQRIREHIPFAHAQLNRERARWLADSLSKRGVALVHFHAGGSMEWGNRRGTKSPMPFLRRAKIPCIFSAHQISPSVLDGYCPKDRSLLYKLALLPAVWLACTYSLSHAAHVLTDCKHDADLFKRQYPLLAKRINFLYHSRLDATQTISPTDDQREKTVLSVGHIAFRKGQQILAEAFARIAPQFPDWKLVMAGPVLQPDCGAQIEKFCAQFPKQIFMPGSHATPQQLMKTAGIFVQPAIFEAFPLALQEAMFSGCPCIGTQTGGIPEQITHNQTGILCPPGDVASLADALADLIRQPDKRRRLGTAAHFGIIEKGITGQAMTANYEKLYQGLLPKRA
jgi:glycosyltransferase involved in cell wall biosynthesis